MASPVVPKLGFLEPWGSTEASLGMRRGQRGTGPAVLLSPDLSTWALGRNFTMRIVFRLHLQWLLFLKIKILALTYRVGMFSPWHPLIVTTHQLSLPHFVLEGGVLCPTPAAPSSRTPGHLPLLQVSASPGKPALVPRGGADSCHSCLLLGPFAADPTLLTELLRCPPSPQTVGFQRAGRGGGLFPALLCLWGPAHSRCSANTVK